MFELVGRVAVITGAGGSLMSVTSAGLAAAGASVAVVDVNLENAQRVALAITEAGKKAIALACDVSSEDAVRSMFETVDRELGRVDILVNGVSAAIERMAPQDLPLNKWQFMLDANLTSYFLCSQEAGRRMIAGGRGGSIINIASTAGVSSLGRGQVAYGVAKGGVIQLTRELAVSWAHHRVRVNAVLPCQFINGWWSQQLASTEKSAMVRRVLDGIPVGRLGQPHEVVGPILFLASDAASMVTGAMLPVDGGNLALNAGGSLAW